MSARKISYIKFLFVLAQLGAEVVHFANCGTPTVLFIYLFIANIQYLLLN